MLMDRRDISRVLLGSAVGAAIPNERVQAQSCVASCFPRTPAEIAASVVPGNQAYPQGDVRRYGAKGDGKVNDGPAIQSAIDVMHAAGGGTVCLNAGIYKIESGLTAKAYVFLEGAYGEFNYGATMRGGGTANTGTQILWAGGENGRMLDVTNVRMFKLDGISFNGNGNATVTAIWVDSTNDPSGSQCEFWRFNIRDCYRGVQWGSSGISRGSFANDGIRFSTFTIWSRVANSVGYTINSGNAGQMSIIENGGIQVQDLGIDIQAANILNIRQVFCGAAQHSGFIKIAIGIDITIDACSSECWGAGKTVPTNGAYFLKTVAIPDAYPMVESCIRMGGNHINNPIICDYPARIVITGDSWGYCRDFTSGLAIPVSGTFSAAPAYSRVAAYVANKDVVSSGGVNYLCIANTTGNAPPNPAYWSASLGRSRCLALNNGVNPNSIDISNGSRSGMRTHGWIDSPYVDLTIDDPALGMYVPAHFAGRYTANGSMTWTVTGPQVETFAWSLRNRMMTVLFTINGSTVGGAANNLLKIAIPNGKVASRSVSTTCFFSDSAVTDHVALCNVKAGGAVINFQKPGQKNWTLGANTLMGEITFEVD